MKTANRLLVARKEDPVEIVSAFNEAINRRDLGALSNLMTEDHVFIDAGDEVRRGKDTMVEGWRKFFDQYPDYRNHFQVVENVGREVLVVGYSTCAFKALDGPALWTAKVIDGRVAEWRVYLDTNQNRKKLNLISGK